MRDPFTHAAVSLLFLAGAVCAQDFRATLTGVVTDPSGAAVPGATVKATHVSTNAFKDARTTDFGIFTIPYLDPGVYNVEVSAPGFLTVIREKIVLRVADKVNLQVELKVGQAAESITVTAEQEVIETASADRGLVFDPIKTQQLPLNGRQTYALMALTPGVLFTQEAFGPGGHSGQRGWDVTNVYRINGARAGQNLFLLNGAPISDAGGTWQVAPNVEAVQEFKVMTNTYDASYGRFGGGVVNTTVKSGTNDWHGNVFEYFRNTVLDANRTGNKQTTPNIRRPTHNQNQFGGILGGALRKDKDFVFFSFEGWREIQPASVVSSVPPTLLRDGQHFSDFGYTVYDPLTSAPCAPPVNCRNSAYVRQPIPGNVIPQSRISPIAQKILSYYPKENYTPNPKALSANYYTNTNGRYRYDQPIGRWDHNIGEADKIYALVTYQHGKEYRNSTGFPPPAGSGDINSQRTDQNYIAAWTHVVSPTTVVDIRGSFGRFTSEFPRYTDYDFTVDKVGMTKMPHAPTNPKSSVPRIDVSGFTQLFSGGSAGEWSTHNQWNFTPSLNMTRGRHTLRTGFEFNYVANAIGNRTYSNGYFTFNANWTRQLSDISASGAAGTFDGSSVASILLGYPASGQLDWADNPYRTRPYFGLYVQDDWKLSSKLTINLGMRYDVQYSWLERFNRYNRGFDLTTKNPMSDRVLANWARIKADYDKKNPKYPYPAPPSQLSGGWLFAGVGGRPQRIFDTDWTNLAPRVGLAWRIARNTVIRTGAGIYYMANTQGGRTNGFSITTNYDSSLDGRLPSAGTSLTGPYSLVDPFPLGILQPTGASEGLLTLIGRGVTFDPSRLKTPRTYQYSFGIQHQLPHDIMAEASFAGNYQTYVPVDWGINEISMADYNQSRADNANYNALQVPSPFWDILPKNGGVGNNATVSRGSLLRPNPLWGGITQANTQWGYYRSDALQVKIEKRVMGGQSTGVMTWVLAYTLSKAYQAANRLQSWNLEEPLVYELDNQDKPHMLSFAGVWDMPLGRGRKLLNSDNAIVNKLAGGWQFDWIFRYVSGYPVGWPNLNNKCGEWHAKEQTRYTWFNNDKSCYETFPSFTLRTIPDRFPDIRQHAAPQLNVALEKTTSISERLRFMIRAEAFNLTNTPIYGGVDTSFTSTRFGMLPQDQQNWPRAVQLAGKFFF
ncbi:MAG: carboxypeptidase regulatory-like domain-containing protein [Bryobacteraceae bacterium]